MTVPKSLDMDQARHFVGPDPDPNCLQKLSADNLCRNLQLRKYYMERYGWYICNYEFLIK